MQSLSNERRLARDRRRRQVRRRRIIALSAGIPLVFLAIWVAYAVPSASPARVPEPSVASPFGSAEGVAKRIVVARLGSVEILLPVRLEATTAIAFHPVDNENSVGFSPVGERVDAGGVAARLADFFGEGGGMRYYQMDGNGSDGSAETAGLDVGAVPGVFVYSPVDGRVVGVKDYTLLGRYTDTEIQLQLAGDPSVLLVITHVTRPAVKIGDEVSAGETALGRVRRYPSEVDQGLSRFTADAGDHVQLVALRMTPQLSGF